MSHEPQRPDDPAAPPSSAQANPPLQGPTTATQGTDGPDQAPAPADLPSQAGRYQVEGEIARGGMGAVLRAHDPERGRPLAVKVLLARNASDPVMARRFLEEAQVCGQLQHPGVPPVHELGALPDGRPFFAMKLVRGHTLAELL